MPTTQRQHASPGRGIGLAPGLLLARMLAIAFLSLAPIPGCAVGTIVGGMAESHRRNSTRLVHAEYIGLTDKSFAVVVAADRGVQSARPQQVARLTTLMTQRLIEHAGASGVVPPSVVLEFQYNNPRWVTLTYDELAEALGVERLIYVDLFEFRLNDPGNAHLWNGLASGTVGVVEADGPLGDDFAYSRQIAVRFPDQDGYTRTSFSAEQISVILEKRFVDRVTWLFYDHQEPFYPDY